MNETITIGKRDGTTETMNLDTFSRWMCLVEAFYVLETHAKERGINDLDKLLKPLAIEEYVNNRYPSMRHDVSVEHKLGIL